MSINYKEHFTINFGNVTHYVVRNIHKFFSLGNVRNFTYVLKFSLLKKQVSLSLCFLGNTLKV